MTRTAPEGRRVVSAMIELPRAALTGGDPDSIHFFHNEGLDYISCSPFRVPVARLEAGRAAPEA